MTRARTHRRERGRLFRRRPRIVPRRRFALALAVPVLACCLGGAAANAAPDPTIVDATIYPGGSGSAQHQTVDLATLERCNPPYSGPTQMYLYPIDQPAQPTTPTTWTLAQVVECGLQEPLGNVANVQVLNPAPGSGQGWEAVLTSGDLSDTSHYNDPHAPGALPVIINNGGQDQNWYVRPWRGGNDNNQNDFFQNNDPITIAVFANGAQLNVTASDAPGAKTASGQTFAFNATVTDPSAGATISPSTLTWNWDFGDGATSTAAQPQHSFAAGAWTVTVQVTDGHRGGNNNITVNAQTQASSTGGTNQTGGGTSTNPTAPATGPVKSGGQNPGQRPGSKKHRGTGKGKNTTPSSSTKTKKPTSQAPHQTTTTTTATPTTPTTPTPGTGNGTGTPGSGSGTGTPGITPAGPPASPSAPAKSGATPPASPLKPSPGPAPSPSGPVVSGLLISDVRPLSAATSPLVHAEPASAGAAPALRRATHVSPIPIIAAGLACVLLFGLGAGRELYGRRVTRP